MKMKMKMRKSNRPSPNPQRSRSHRSDLTNLELYQKLPKPNQSGSAVSLKPFPLRPKNIKPDQGNTSDPEKLRMNWTTIMLWKSSFLWTDALRNIIISIKNLQENLLYSNRRPCLFIYSKLSVYSTCSVVNVLYQTIRSVVSIVIFFYKLVYIMHILA